MSNDTRIRLIQAFIKAGWNPPRPTSEIVDRIAQDMELAPANATLVLTPQQLKVLQLYAEGYTEKMIASKLAISTHWVHEMGKRLRGRLGARNTAHAVAIGLRDGIIE